MARKMKDSGIEWIGEIPEGWSIARGKHILTLLQRAVFPTDGVITCFRDGEVTLRSNRREDGFTVSLKEIGYQGIEPGDLVVHGMDGFAGSIGISDSRGKSSPVLVVLDSSQDKKYLMYYLRSMAYNNVFLALSTGIRVRSCDLKWNKLTDLLYLVPPIVEQHKLVSFLDEKCSEIDAMLSKTRASIEEYKKLKQAIITQAVTTGVHGEREMKNSKIEWVGNIPIDWKTIKLKYCTYIRARLGWKALKADEYVEIGFPFLSAFNIVNNTLQFTNLNYINQFRYDESPEIQLSNGDVLLVKDGAGIGKCAIVENMPMPSTVNGSIAVVSVTNSLIPKYLYYYFLSKMFQQHIDLLKDGMGVPHLFQSDLKEIKIAFPSKDEQKEIADYLDGKCAEIDKLIAKKEQLVKELENYKKSLIYEVVTGKREV